MVGSPVTVYKPRPAICSQSIGKSYRGSLHSVVDNGLTGCFIFMMFIVGSFYKKLHISCPTGLNDHIIIFDGN